MRYRSATISPTRSFTGRPEGLLLRLSRGLPAGSPPSSPSRGRDAMPGEPPGNAPPDDASPDEAPLDEAPPDEDSDEDEETASGPDIQPGEGSGPSVWSGAASGGAGKGARSDALAGSGVARGPRREVSASTAGRGGLGGRSGIRARKTTSAVELHAEE